MIVDTCKLNQVVTTLPQITHMATWGRRSPLTDGYRNERTNLVH